MIKSLTKEQESLLPVYADKWIKIGLSTEECSVEAVRPHIQAAYKVAELEPPEYIIGPFNSPFEGAVAEHVLKSFVKNKTEFEDESDLNSKVTEEVYRLIDSEDSLGSNLTIANMAYGNSEYWLSYYDYIQEVLEVDISDSKPLIEIAKLCGWWTPLQNVAIIQHRPLEINLDDRGRLHCVDGPAIKFRGKYDHSNVYAVNGVTVTKKIVERDYNVSDIDSETNAEVRRVMIELYGQEKYIVDSKATLVHKDDFGELYRKELDGDEPLMMVKVVNSTQEPDGSYKDYWIRVDPNAYGGLKTARDAVASTWRKKGDNSLVFKTSDSYDPDIET